MRALVSAAVFGYVILVTGTSYADQACEPGFVCLKPQVIYGRPPKPIAAIELQRTTPAAAAAAAHDEMRAEWLRELVPQSLRPSR